MDRELFKRLVESYKKYLGGNLVSIVLFGSRARGDAKPKSDYDILIVADNLPANPLARSRFIRKPVAGKFEERLSIIAKTRDEITGSFPPLFLDIGLDGKLLYDDGFFANRLRRIRDIIESAGLKRVLEGNDYHWEWKNYPKKGWAIDWEGYHELPR
ncbi:MAG: nucleotidyltransferase domain-containing protein [bacterium]